MTTMRSLIMGNGSAILIGLLLHLIIPGLVGVVIAVVASGATLLDPLYAGDRVSIIWSSFGLLLLLQAIHTFISTPVVATLLSVIDSKIESGWLYLIGFILSPIIHYVILGVIALVLSLLSERAGSIAVLSAVIVTFVAPLLGLISTFMIRRAG